MMPRKLILAGMVVLASLGAASGCAGTMVDTLSGTWVATDALGRTLPMHAQVGPLRPDRTVGIFYFLWHGPHVQGGPYDVSRILAQDPGAMSKPDSPLWGPLHAPHHWGQSVFGYYRSDDEGVLRKHAQMLADAGIDTVIFDVTNQLTYPEQYSALLRVWSECRAAGNRTPAVAFLTPFWDPRKVVRELWRDLYQPGHYRDLWFCWEGNPLILADPDLIDARESHEQQNTPVELVQRHTLGQAFAVNQPFRAVGGRFPTWRTTDSCVTLTLRPGGTNGPALATRRFTNVADNAWLMLPIEPPLPPARYLLEASDPEGKIGWWSHTDDVHPQGQAMADGLPASGDRTLRIGLADEEAARIREFFTFRKPQPDYFRGPTKADMWSWLEVHPQHVFTNAAGQKEQMSVGVAQNAVGGRLGSMSEPGALGRSHHKGAFDARPGAVLEGHNVAEQWERALAEDPRFVFVTGWNEWIAGRFAEFAGIRHPVMFVDQFDQEHSRDIEPMRGGHGDNYYYQLVSYVRRYKGAPEAPRVTSKPTRIDGRFEDWREVLPEFRDTAGDAVRRGHPGWDTNVLYANSTGRNDILAAKVSIAPRALCFYAQTLRPLTLPEGTNWMILLLDLDANPSTGWLGYDVMVNRTRPREHRARVERHAGPGFRWVNVGTAPMRFEACELEIAIPLDRLGLQSAPSRLDFKWADNCIEAGGWEDFTLNGDAAPNDRFNFRALFPQPGR